MVNPRDIAGEHTHTKKKNHSDDDDNNNSNNDNNDNNNKDFERRCSRLLQSSHCATNCLRPVCSSAQSGLMCRSHATFCVPHVKFARVESAFILV